MIGKWIKKRFFGGVFFVMNCCLDGQGSMVGMVWTFLKLAPMSLSKWSIYSIKMCIDKLTVLFVWIATLIFQRMLWKFNSTFWTLQFYFDVLSLNFLLHTYNVLNVLILTTFAVVGSETITYWPLLQQQCYSNVENKVALSTMKTI